MRTISEDRLAPCPFCGCTDIIASNVGEDEDIWFVGCMEAGCGVNPSVFCPDSEAEAIAAWNLRAPPSGEAGEVTGEMVERAKRMIGGGSSLDDDDREDIARNILALRTALPTIKEPTDDPAGS